MIMKKVVWGGKLAALLLCTVAATSCGNVVRQGTGSSYLILTALEAAPGTSQTFGGVLQSDVLNVNTTTNAQTIAADQGRATFQLAMKDVTDPTGPTTNNFITVTQYQVEYVRSDGRNIQGVDVPFSFSGGVTTTVSGTASVPFTLVRIQAKQEAPLAALAFGGGANAITTVARVTFFGHDQTGREVSVTGNIEVDFSDWAG